MNWQTDVIPKYDVVNNPNAGHTSSVYFKAYSSRPYVVTVDSDYLRDKVGRVRRFASRRKALEAITFLHRA